MKKKKPPPPVKGKKPPVVTDGRADPAAATEETFAACLEAAGRPNPKLAAAVTSTPIAHQSGEGVRGYRESIHGISKVSVIRWCGHKGLDLDRVFRFVSTYCYMTLAVCKKAYREGQSGHYPADLPAELVAAIKTFK